MATGSKLFVADKATQDNIKENVNYLLANPKVVKSVQRGLIVSAQNRGQLVTINAVIPAKSLVIITGASNTAGTPAIPYSLSANQITIFPSGASDTIFSSGMHVIWQVIEFY